MAAALFALDGSCKRCGSGAEGWRHGPLGCSCGLWCGSIAGCIKVHGGLLKHVGVCVLLLASHVGFSWPCAAFLAQSCAAFLAQSSALSGRGCYGGLAVDRWGCPLYCMVLTRLSANTDSVHGCLRMNMCMHPAATLAALAFCVVMFLGMLNLEDCSCKPQLKDDILRYCSARLASL